LAYEGSDDPPDAEGVATWLESPTSNTKARSLVSYTPWMWFLILVELLPMVETPTTVVLIPREEWCAASG
jgi:hypothetical protein